MSQLGVGGGGGVQCEGQHRGGPQQQQQEKKMMMLAVEKKIHRFSLPPAHRDSEGITTVESESSRKDDLSPVHLVVALLNLHRTYFTLISRSLLHSHQQGAPLKAGPLTDEADDAADQRVEVAAVARHDGLLLEQQGLPGGPHHVHGHLTHKNLVRETHKHTQVNKGSFS